MGDTWCLGLEFPDVIKRPGVIGLVFGCEFTGFGQVSKTGNIGQNVSYRLLCHSFLFRDLLKSMTGHPCSEDPLIPLNLCILVDSRQPVAYRPVARG